MLEKYFLFHFVRYGQFTFVHNLIVFWRESILFLTFSNGLKPLYGTLEYRNRRSFDFVRVTQSLAAGGKHQGTQSLLSAGCTELHLLGWCVSRMRKWISTPRIGKIKEL